MFRSKEEQFDFYWKEIFTGLAYNPIEFNTYRFDQTMSLPGKVNKLYDMFKVLAMNNQEVMDYLKEFVETFDVKLYETIEDVLTVWLEDGRLADVVRVAISEEVIEARTDYLGKKYVDLKERLDSEKAESLSKTNEIEEDIVEVTTKLTQAMKGIYIASDGNLTHSQLINNTQTQATTEKKTLVIKSGTYVLPTTVQLTDNVVFEKNVIFRVVNDVDGVNLNYSGRPIDFNGLKVFVDVENYSKRAFTINGCVFGVDKFIREEWNSYNFVGDLLVENTTTVHPYHNASGTGVCFKINTNQIFMWTKFRIFSAHFKNGFEFYSTGTKGSESFVSSCDFELTSWRNTNTLLFNYDFNKGWGDCDFRVKNQPAQNQEKILKLQNNTGDGKHYSPSSCHFDFTLWDMNFIAPEKLSTLIEVTDGRNKFINRFDDGTRSLSKHIQWKTSTIYAPTRLKNDFDTGNIFSTNPWDYIYTFGKGIVTTDTFEVAVGKLIANAKELKHNTDIVLEYSASPSGWVGEFYDKVRPLIPRVPNDNFGQGKIRITISYYNYDFKDVYVEFIASGGVGVTTVIFQAHRYYDVKNLVDSKWVVLGDLFGTTAQREQISSEIRLSTGLKFYDTTLSKPLFYQVGWRDSNGNLV